MRLINKRFKIIGELEKILNHETYKVEDLKDNSIKRITFYDQEKDKKNYRVFEGEFTRAYKYKA